jgi:dihydroorotate dehydrogenase
VYKALFKLVFVHLDPERAHTIAFRWIRLFAAVPPLRGLAKAVLSRAAGRGGRPVQPPQPVQALGRTFPGPLGVAAGFDKDARGVRGLLMVGFSYVEVGTITRWPQPGNPKPRLWRLLAQRALRNAMGFNNHGAAAAAKTLQRLRQARGGWEPVVGVNIGKSKVTPVDQAPEDYRASARHLAPYADYLVINVSSPNTPGLRDLQAVEALEPIIVAAREGAAEGLAAAGRPGPVPLLVKIAPDLSNEDIDAVADLARRQNLAGLVAVNTTIQHDLGAGGVSGPPLKARGLEVVARLRARLGEGPVIIGVGGIETAADVRDYLAAGATLVQAYTAFIYHGPAWPYRVQRG